MNKKPEAGQLAPLVQRRLDDRIAYVRSSLPALAGKCGYVKVETFLAHVHSLAQALPPHSYALNLCDNRYLFMVAFCAAVVREQSNLLPPNKNIATQQTLASRYEGVYVLHDGVEVAEGLPDFNINELVLEETGSAQIPDIDLAFLSAITFTSGSTGESKPNLKPWRTFVDSTDINANYMLLDGEQLSYQLATVPGQHMWGMETSILLPLMKRVCVCDAKPLFPKDIAKVLAELDSPRMMVSTPVHLRAMNMSGIDFPEVSLVLCATAPLSDALAADVEKLFNGKLQEVYGCSEVGSMSFRRTSQSQTWTIFDGIDFVENEEGYRAEAVHLPVMIQLQDRLEKIGERQFQLLGRSDDMVEIAGKRGSLQEMNKVLLNTPGVDDGIAFIPEQNSAVSRVAAIVVLNEEGSKEKIAQRFRECLDAAFVPRPIIAVPNLPREENGKFPRKKLLAFYQEIKS